jgi:hypothetical protein
MHHGEADQRSIGHRISNALLLFHGLLYADDREKYGRRPLPSAGILTEELQQLALYARRLTTTFLLCYLLYVHRHPFVAGPDGGAIWNSVRRPCYFLAALGAEAGSLIELSTRVVTVFVSTGFFGRVTPLIAVTAS